jgi:hypothetical protein
VSSPESDIVTVGSSAQTPHDPETRWQARIPV